MTYTTDETITKQYVNENMSIKDIAKCSGVTYSAIYKRLIRLGIYKKEGSPVKNILNLDNTKNTKNSHTRLFIKQLELKGKEIGEPVKDYLKRMYWDEEKSPKEIGLLLNMPSSTVGTWMRQLGLKFRTKSESLKLYLKNNPKAHQHNSKTFNDVKAREKSYAANRELRQGKKIEEIYGPNEAKRLRALYSEQRKGELNPIYGTKRPQHVCDALSKAHKGKKQDPEFRIRRLTKAFEKARMSPNNLESRIINIVDRYDLPFKFVGDGSMIIHGFAPDFVSTDGSMKIVEVFGDYWHSDKNPDLTYVRTEEGRKKVFAELGYDMLVLWESKINTKTDELLRDEIINFMNGINSITNKSI